MMELASRFGRVLLQLEAIARGHGVSGKQLDVLVTGLEPTDLVRAPPQDERRARADAGSVHDHGA